MINRTLEAIHILVYGLRQLLELNFVIFD